MAGLVGACVDTSGAGGTTVGSATAATTTTGGGSTMMGAGGAAGGPGAGGMTGAGGSGTGGSDTCVDQGTGEPNETMATATQLAGGSDCDDLSTTGTIDGPDDVDWYLAVQTADEAGCIVEPGRDWSQAAGHTIRVCKYVECQTNNMSPSSVSCEDGAQEDTHNGLEGCCHTGPFAVDVGLITACPGEDILNVYTRIDEPGAPADNCNTYNLNYTF